MKARIRATGEIVEVSMECNNSTDYRKAIFRTKDGMYYRYDDVELAFDNLTMATGIIPKDATCRTCMHRGRGRLNCYSNKVIQCCTKQPSKRSNSGFKTIKVTDPACFRYELMF